MSVTVSRFQTLRGAATSELRTAQYEAREHLVVPVIAMVGDSVVFPVNADTPELVPSEALAQVPIGWDGRPVLSDHPAAGHATANDPRTLERMKLGELFNTRFEDGKLKTEAWLDVKRCERLGGDAFRALERVRNLETIEVSVGAWITGERVSGRRNGQSYEFVWLTIVPDHLALLPEGSIGACSVDMGCGAPRINRATVNDSAMLLRVAKEDAMKEAKHGMSRRIWDAGLLMLQSYGITAAAGAEMSDMELRNVLHDALRANEPGFDGILEVFADSGVVIYATVPENELLLYQRSFSRDEEGAVSLADDRELVEPVTEFKPVAAEAVSEPAVKDEEEPAAVIPEPAAVEPKPAAEPVAEPVQAKSVSSGCGCGGDGPCACADAPEPAKKTDIGGMQTAPTKAPLKAAKKKGVRMSDANVKLVVARLITSDRTPFTGDDEETLLAFPEDRLKALEESLTEEFITPEPPPEPEPMTDEEWIAAAPPAVRGLFQRFQDEDEKQRNLLINSLVRVQQHYNKKQLEAKPTEELEILCEMLKIHAPKRDYSGRGLVARFSDTNDEGVPTPPDMGRYIRAKRAGKSREDAMRDARSN